MKVKCYIRGFPVAPIDNAVAENSQQGFVAAKPERPQTVPPHLPTKAGQVTVFAVSIAPPITDLFVV